MTEKLLKWNKSQAEYAYVTLTRYLPVQVSILPDSRLNPECISLLRSQAAISGKGCVDVTLAYLEKKNYNIWILRNYITVSPAQRKFLLQVEPVPRLFGWHISSPKVWENFITHTTLNRREMIPVITILLSLSNCTMKASMLYFDKNNFK